MTKRIILVILLIAWAGTIFMCSNLNSSMSGTQTMVLFRKVSRIPYKVLKFLGLYNNTQYENESFLEFTSRNYMLFRKLCHAFVYFVFSVLLYKTLKFIFNYNHFYISSFTLLICIIFSLLDEFHQGFVRGRASSLIDCLIDNIGTVLGIIFSIVLYQITMRIKNKKKENELVCLT